MTQPGEHRRSQIGDRRSAFTLVELILVMALLAIVMALSVPSLSRSMRGRQLAGEATRLLATIEYARSEAISQGIPVVVWVDATAGRFGVEAKAGFEGDAQRERDTALDSDIRIELTGATGTRGIVEAVSFQPDGTPETGSAEALRLIDRSNSEITIARTPEALAYEILKPAQ